MDNHTFSLNQQQTDGITGNRMATLCKMNMSAFLPIDFNGTEPDLATEMLSCQFSNMHGNINRQGMAHPDVIQYFFKRCLFIVKVFQISFFNAV